MKDRFGITDYDYDGLSRLIKVDGPQANDTIRYEYDNVGNRTKMINQDNGVTVYSYDQLNRLKTITDPQAKVTTYNYDPVSNLKSVIYPNAITASYGFDNLNRLLNLNYRNAASQVISSSGYEYDGIGRKKKMVAVDGEVHFGYDALSRLISEQRTGSNPYGILYEYDKSGNRALMAKGSSAIIYTYNSLNQLLEERRKSSQNSAAISVSGTVDDNTARVLVETKSAQVSNGQFQVSGITVNRGLNQITALAEDPAGNKSYHQIQVNVLDPVLRKYTYDKNGNLIKKEEGSNTTSYIYDYENRLIKVQGLSPQGTVPETLASYTYDGEGKRVSGTESGVTTYYFYDGLLPIIERNSSGVTQATYVRGLSYGGGIGGIISRRPGVGGSQYYLYDGLGNVTRLTDSTGKVVQTYTYEAFGNVVAQSGTITNPYQFQTKQFNSATGLVNFGFRYYNPAIGRFITADPLGMINGPNLYAYVGNNPLNWIDPFGLCRKMTDEELFNALGDLAEIATLSDEQHSELEKILREIAHRQGRRMVRDFEIGEAVGFGIGKVVKSLLPALRKLPKIHIAWERHGLYSLKGLGRSGGAIKAWHINIGRIHITAPGSTTTYLRGAWWRIIWLSAPK